MSSWPSLAGAGEQTQTELLAEGAENGDAGSASRLLLSPEAVCTPAPLGAAYAVLVQLAWRFGGLMFQAGKQGQRDKPAPLQDAMNQS